MIEELLKKVPKPYPWCPNCGAGESWRHSLQVQFQCGSAVVEGRFDISDECGKRKAAGLYLAGAYDSSGTLR